MLSGLHDAPREQYLTDLAVALDQARKEGTSEVGLNAVY
jgi:thiamine pyrophosphokinase